MMNKIGEKSRLFKNETVLVIVVQKQNIQNFCGHPENIFFCAIVLYLVVYHVCFQDGKLCLLVANDKLDGK
jgi:hypothetical protein